MNILVSVNDKYIMPLIVMLTSLLDSCQCSLSIWFISKSTSEKSIKMVSDFVVLQGGEFHLLKITDDFFRGKPTLSHISEEAYFRLLAAELLPEDVDRILWLDADMIVTKDLQDLYNMPLGKHALAGNAYNERCFETEYMHYEKLGLSFSEYINTGVMLINLNKWRELHMRDKIAEVFSKGYDIKYADQDIANLIFKDQISYIPRKYNFRVRKTCRKSDFEWARENAAIVHYSGVMKPWMVSDLPLGDIWYRCYKKSPYSDRKLHRISTRFLSMLVEKSIEGKIEM